MIWGTPEGINIKANMLSTMTNHSNNIPTSTSSLVTTKSVEQLHKRQEQEHHHFLMKKHHRHRHHHHHHQQQSSRRSPTARNVSDSNKEQDERDRDRERSRENIQVNEPPQANLNVSNPAERPPLSLTARSSVTSRHSAPCSLPITSTPAPSTSFTSPSIISDSLTSISSSPDLLLLTSKPASYSGKRTHAEYSGQDSAVDLQSTSSQKHHHQHQSTTSHDQHQSPSRQSTSRDEGANKMIRLTEERQLTSTPIATTQSSSSSSHALALTSAPSQAPLSLSASASTSTSPAPETATGAPSDNPVASCSNLTANVSNPRSENLSITQRQQQQQVVALSSDNASILLPFFVIVEGYRVAAYSLGGEPRLCLPQLIQFLRQKFTVKKIVEKFEISNAKFATATHKQVQGFIRFKALLPEAKACPLIKFSDANRVCLRLYESCHKRRGDGQLLTEASGSSSFALSSLIHRPEERSLSQSSIQQHHHSLFDKINSNKFEENFDPRISLLRVEDQRQDSSSSTLNNSEMHQPGSNPLFIRDKSLTQSPLFGNLANQSRLYRRLNPFDPSEVDTNLTLIPETLSATLRVQIYHRCIGKCSGSYYPYLLKNGKAKCIQCKICKIFLPPRRFVGHTHKSKEDNTCHWGFNSYNWRCYIRLSRKQADNNLDDSELLNQFRTLQFAPDFVDEIDDSDYDLDSSDATQIIDPSRPDQLNRRASSSSSQPTTPLRFQDWRQRASSFVSNIPSQQALSQAISQATPTVECDPRFLVNPLASGCRAPYNFNTLPLFGDGFPRPRLNISGNESQSAQSSSSGPYDHIYKDLPSESLNLFASQPTPLNYRDEYCKMFSATRAGQTTIEGSSLETNPLKNLKESFPFTSPSAISQLQAANQSASFFSAHDDKEFRREMYVYFKLAEFLTRRGIEQGIINDVIESTLNLMRESRRFVA